MSQRQSPGQVTGQLLIILGAESLGGPTKRVNKDLVTKIHSKKAETD